MERPSAATRRYPLTCGDGRLAAPKNSKIGHGSAGIADHIEAELVERLGRDTLDAWRRVTDALIEIHLDEAPDAVRVAAEMSSAPD